MAGTWVAGSSQHMRRANSLPHARSRLRRFGEVLKQAAAHGESPASWLALGNGAVLYRDALQTLGIEVPPEESPLHRIDGEAICALGSIGVAQAIDTLLPDYRRRPDAELALDRGAAQSAGAGTGAGAGAGVEVGVGGGT